MTQHIAFQPHPGKQTLIFTTQCDQILAGGGKKGGKTAVALGLPLRHINDPRFRCLIIRRTIPGLEYIEAQARKLYGRLVPPKWLDKLHNKSKHLFTFPSGAIVKFWFAETLDDYDKMEGGGWQMVIVDEARQYPDPLLLDMIASEMYAEVDPATGEPWMRTKLVLLSNPGGRGGDWLRERFAIDKFPKGGVRIYDQATGQYRIYIHFTVYDNPSVDAAKYVSTLRQFPLWKQKQMIDGDWFQKEGSAFEEFDMDTHVIDQFDTTGCEIHRSCDWGFSTVCSVHWWAVNPDHYGTVCIGERHFTRTKPRDVARAIRKVEEANDWEVISGVIGKDACGTNASGISPKNAMAEVGVHWRTAKDDRNEGYHAVVARLATQIELWDGTFIPAVRFVRKACPHLIRTLPVLPQKVGEDDVDKLECKKANSNKGNDHDYDDMRYHFMSLQLPEKAPDRVEHFGGVPETRRERPATRDRYAQRGF